MRRLAKQDRQDKVRSTRDYQTVHERQGVTITLDPDQPCRLTFCSDIKERGNVPFTGAGVYISTDVAAEIKLTLTGPDGHTKEGTFQCDEDWARAGLAVGCNGTGEAQLVIDIPGHVKDLHIWGLDCGALQLPEMVVEREGATEQELNSTQSPECLYLPQERAVDMDPVPAEWQSASISERPGKTIHLKKCAYCQRLLPLDPKRPSALAFHKHNAKKTGHQNECRSCKKWRINNEFNPKRTTDQHHESSVISRERKIFLRDPEILERIKERDGAGLKSIVWERFGRKCFRCERPIELNEVQLDHTRPLAYLWPIDEYATCLCGACNNFKRERFPVDVYTEPQLHRLSAITGLPYEELLRKEVNQPELNRILENIAGFALEWDPRMFNATTRKVRELLPEIDLFEVLRQADEEVFDQVIASLEERPEAVEVEG
jgi:hypothetical protein